MAAALPDDTTRAILEALHFGTSDQDDELIAGLAADVELGLPDGVPFEVAVSQVPSDLLVAALLRQVAPFARMLVEIYRFLAARQSTMAGSSTLLVSDALRGDVEFDLDNFERIVRPILDQLTRIDLDCLTGSLANQFNDGYWPPVCLDDAQPRPVECADCDGVTVPDAFARATAGLTQIFTDLRLRYPFIDGQTLAHGERLDVAAADLEWLRRGAIWAECQQRKPRPNCIRYGAGFAYEWLMGTVEAFDRCQRSVDIERMIELFALPFWRHRYQIFEIWVLVLVLTQLEGIPLRLRRDNGRWIARYGFPLEQPVAEATLDDGSVLEIFYQNQRLEEGAAFDAEVRPEIVVRRRWHDGHAETLLLVECKARHDYREQEFSKDLAYYYVQLHPRLLIGANYFGLKPKHGLTTGSFAPNHDLVVVDELQPGSADTRRLAAILYDFWAKTLGVVVHVVLVDVSGSMPRDELRKLVPTFTARIERLPAVNVVVAAFSESVMYADDAPVADFLQSALGAGGGTRLGEALKTTRVDIAARFPTATAIRYFLVTDLQVPADELEQLQTLAAEPTVDLTIAARHDWVDAGLLEQFPGLRDRISWLPG